ncbi:MAG: excinuclease ABC subunit UvrC [Rhizobiales bacterium]|nr:excinuclease ABC subunit UvrC [Hyphomicrobiales bacterium]NRB14069.1 excinuclease ABC subunit UvrC [Hyphomicrobiales bacterium]
MNDVISGPELIKQYAKTLPSKPGVYRMFAKDGRLLYVGKAKSLVNRVNSYTRISSQSNRIVNMILQTHSMEFVTTQSEAEALLLEANLIKRLQPKYNILLRDDKSFPYIFIKRDHEAAQIIKHRGARKAKGQYFGPFAATGAVNRTISILQRAFLLRTCSDSYYNARSRPCLLYQIKRCSAPCTGEITLEAYDQLVGQAEDFLQGKSSHIKQEIQAKMAEASEDMEYELAAFYRDRMSALTMIQSDDSVNPTTIVEGDIFALHQQGGQVAIQVFFIRAGQNWGNRCYYPKIDKSHEPDDILASFIAQFYDNKPCPKQLIVSHELPNAALLAEALASRIGHKVEIIHPKRGDKMNMMKQALRNAQEALGRKLAETSSQKKLLSQVGEKFGLTDMPERIEIYDNSHISGSHAIGAMVVAGVEGFLKSQYRKFNIKSDIAAGDDYGMMREVLTRRFKRMLAEQDDPTKQSIIPQKPDIVFVDGGKGQLSIAVDVFKELNIDDIILVGIAKGPERNAGRETFYLPDGTNFMLPPKDPVLYYMQRMRDEAHRFAIGTHRAKRSKALIKSPLDEISSIGASRKKALLNHFGSAKAVSGASAKNIALVGGISQKLAQHIYDHFHED